MENNFQNLDFDEEKINFLLENVDKLPQILSKEEIDLLLSKLKHNLGSIEKIIEDLKGQENE
jgi:hypothetical protein